MKKNLFAAAFLLVLASCATLPAQTDSNNFSETFPENYKKIVLEYIKTSFFDPYSIRGAQISVPRVGPSWEIGKKEGWIVCIRANAKNRMGAYIGLTDTALLIRENKVEASISGTVPYYCNSASYEPFPEVQQIN